MQQVTDKTAGRSNDDTTLASRPDLSNGGNPFDKEQNLASPPPLPRRSSCRGGAQRSGSTTTTTNDPQNAEPSGHPTNRPPRPTKAEMGHTVADKIAMVLAETGSGGETSPADQNGQEDDVWAPPILLRRPRAGGFAESGRPPPSSGGYSQVLADKKDTSFGGLVVDLTKAPTPLRFGPLPSSAPMSPSVAQPSSFHFANGPSASGSNCVPESRNDSDSDFEELPSDLLRQDLPTNVTPDALPQPAGMTALAPNHPLTLQCTPAEKPAAYSSPRQGQLLMTSAFPFSKSDNSLQPPTGQIPPLENRRNGEQLAKFSHPDGTEDSTSPLPPPIPPRMYSPAPSAEKNDKTVSTDGDKVPRKKPSSTSSDCDREQMDHVHLLHELTLPLAKNRRWQYQVKAPARTDTESEWIWVDKETQNELNTAVQWRHIDVTFVANGKVYRANLPKMTIAVTETGAELPLRCHGDVVGTGAWYSTDIRGQTKAVALSSCLEMEESLLEIIEMDEPPQLQQAKVFKWQEGAKAKNLSRAPPLVEIVRADPSLNLSSLSAEVELSLKQEINPATSEETPPELNKPAKLYTPVCSLLQSAKSRQWKCQVDGQWQVLSQAGNELLNVAVQRRQLEMTLTTGKTQKRVDLPLMTLTVRNKVSAMYTLSGRLS